MNWFSKKKSSEEDFLRSQLESSRYFTQLWITRFDELEKKFRAVCHENNKLRAKMKP